MLLDYKLVPDRSQEFKYNLNYQKEFNTRHFYFAKLYFVEIKM